MSVDVCWNCGALVGQQHAIECTEIGQVTQVNVRDPYDRIAELETALAAAQQAQRDAEAERDNWRNLRTGHAYSARDYKQRAEAAEAELQRARELLEVFTDPWKRWLNEPWALSEEWASVKIGSVETMIPIASIRAALEATRPARRIRRGA